MSSFRCTIDTFVFFLLISVLSNVVLSLPFLPLFCYTFSDCVYFCLDNISYMRAGRHEISTSI